MIRNGPTKDHQRLPQTLNIGFPGLDGDALLMQLDLAGIAASLGSACASGSTRPSPDANGNACSRRPFALIGSV